jgi:Ca-activated chloride channel family protein
MSHLQFAQPHWLWIGALCCAVTVVLLARAARLRRRAVAALAGARFVTTVGRGRRLAKQVLVVAGIAATFVALARPLGGFRWEEERRDGIDLMFAVDTSKSMLTTDLRPDRLTRAKLAVSDLLRKFPGERVGLIAFAGEAFVQAPMTIDHAVFGEALDALDTSIIPRGGTDIATPIRAAVEAMATEPDRRKLLVILSDGEDLQGEALAAAKEAAHAGLVIYTVGVGTRSGDLIPVEHDGQRDVVRDAEGHFVTSRLDEQTLRQLAEITGGAYAPLGASGQGLETLYSQHLAQLPRRTVEERMHKVYTERFQIPLAVAISCLMLELALGERRRRGRAASRPQQTNAPERPARTDSRPDRSRASSGIGVAAAVMLAMAGPSRPAVAATAPAPHPAAAATATSTYNDGTAAYRKKDFAAARDRFQAATHTTDLPMQEDAYYDLGNARYRLGQATLTKDRPGTIDVWKTAVASYDGALALQPKDADARFNRDLVARRLAALEEQERQNQQQKNQQQKNQPDQKNQKDQKQSQGKQPEASSGQGQQDQKDQKDQKAQSSPQNGAGQPQPGQGSPSSAQGSNGKQPSASQGQPPSGGQGSGEQAKQDQARNQAGPQKGDGQKGVESGQPQQGESPKDRTDRGSAEQSGAHADPKNGPRQGPAQTSPAAQGPNASPQGPGVVSAQPGQPAGQERSAVAKRAPGALTPDEAVQLLDSVSGELHRLPVADARRRPSNNSDDTPAKDW